MKSLGRVRTGMRVCALAVGILTTMAPSTLGAAAVTAHGYVAHSAYGLQLSVPNFWSVAYFQNCPIRNVGTLLIGRPAYLNNCALIPANANTVSMQLQQAEAVTPGPSKHLVVHGVNVISVSTGLKSYSGTVWIVPSKHVVLTATGPHSSAVLRTLAAATSRAVPAPGMLRGSVYLVALMRTAITGPVSVTRLAPHAMGSTTVAAYDGQFSDTVPPGSYLLKGHAGDAPCPPVRVTVQSGQIADAPEINCQGA